MVTKEQIYTYQEEIREIALDYGLDPYDTIFELVDWHEIHQAAAYLGFPTRYSHWRFGMEYERLQKTHKYGLQRIFELVINNDPAYAYLLDTNSLTDQKMVIAHVYGHSDFFKNNMWYSGTSRNMMNEMENHAKRIEKHSDEQGYEKVERFLDACLSLENLIDYHQRLEPQSSGSDEGGREETNGPVQGLEGKSYMEEFMKSSEEEQQPEVESQQPKQEQIPGRPQKDVLMFLMQHAPLEDWQVDILSIVRDEALYLAPQKMTKIMNEGWATYWHSKMMTEDVCEDSEIIQYASKHSSTVSSQSRQMNPYKLGLELFRDIEERWDKGRFGKEYEMCEDRKQKQQWDTGLGEGREKIFQVRKIYHDLTFIDEFLTEEFCERKKLFTYSYNQQRDQYEISSRDFDDIKEKLLFQLTNRGEPIIKVVDGNYQNRKELLLVHEDQGVGLELSEAKRVLENLYHLWTRPVHLETLVDEEKTRLTFDGEKHRSKGLTKQKTG